MRKKYEDAQLGEKIQPNANKPGKDILPGESDHRLAKPKEVKDNTAEHILAELNGAVGQIRNNILDTVTGMNSSGKILSSIDPKLAKEYLHAKDLIQSGKDKEPTLSQSDKDALRHYDQINNKIIGSIPFYEHEALTKKIEEGIRDKAKQDKPEIIETPSKIDASQKLANGDKPSTQDRKPTIVTKDATGVRVNQIDNQLRHNIETSPIPPLYNKQLTEQPNGKVTASSDNHLLSLTKEASSTDRSIKPNNPAVIQGTRFDPETEAKVNLKASSVANHTTNIVRADHTVGHTSYLDDPKRLMAFHQKPEEPQTIKSSLAKELHSAKSEDKYNTISSGTNSSLQKPNDRLWKNDRSDKIYAQHDSTKSDPQKTDTIQGQVDRSFARTGFAQYQANKDADKPVSQNLKAGSLKSATKQQEISTNKNNIARQNSNLPSSDLNSTSNPLRNALDSRNAITARMQASRATADTLSLAKMHATFMSKIMSKSPNVVINWARSPEKRLHTANLSIPTTSHAIDSQDTNTLRSISKISGTGTSSKSSKSIGQPQISDKTNNAYVVADVLPQRRYAMGAEVMLAAIIAAAGTRRIRHEENQSSLSSQTEFSLPIKATSKTENLPVFPQNDPTQDLWSKETVTNSRLHTSLSTSLTNLNQQKQPTENSLNTKENSVSPTDENDLLSNSLLKRSSNQRNRFSVLILPSDTLVTIAQMFFHDEDIAWLIADLNSNVAKETWIDGKRIIEFHSRQQIALPNQEEIVQFLATQPEHARAKNLITIIHETQIDRELLETSWQPILGHANKQSFAQTIPPSQNSQPAKSWTDN